MGIQSTQYITRKQAEQMFLEDYILNNEARIRREAQILTDEELEDALERTFDNYKIVEDEHAES